VRALVPLVTTLAFLALLPPAEGAFPGGNGRLVWKTHTDTGPQVRTGRLEGRGHRKVGELEDFVSGASEQSGYARWSPSGRRLVYFDLAGDGVVVKSARGRLIRRVTKGLWDPDWSPGGQELITSDYDAEDQALVRIRMDGSVVRRIDVGEMGSPLWPRWSPTGEWIAFHEAEPRAQYVARVRPDGSGAERLTEGWRPTWSPDGRRIAFARPPDVYTMRADGSGIRRVMKSRVRETDIRGITWSPDGRRIAIATDQYENEPRRPFRIVTVPSGGGRPTIHRRSASIILGLDWQSR
jgi:Tol biopolymer transport system component